MRNRLLCLAVTLVVMVALAPFTRAQTAAAPSGAKKAAAKEPVPDLTGDWNSGAGASWNPSDRGGKLLEDGTPYQPWALAKLKSERPGFGANATFENTTDPNIRFPCGSTESTVMTPIRPGGANRSGSTRMATHWLWIQWALTTRLGWTK
jgi:hypothetical protein